MKRDIKLYNFNRGQMLIMALIFLAIVMILAASLFSRTAGFLRFGSNNILREQATNLAEAGVERALWQLNQTTGAYTGETNTALGSTGTFTVSITNKAAALKTITSTGYIPNSATPRAKRTIKVDALIGTTNIAFRYAVQVGTDGVTMENSSAINGTVYSNGNITGSGITTIDGDAYALGTISSPDPFVTGNKFPASAPSEMPTIDYQTWKDQATAGGVIDCNTTPSLCNLSSGSVDIGPKKYLGNLTLSNTVGATMNGPIYVACDATHPTCNTEVKNSAVLKLNDSFGSTGSVLIADGTITVRNGGSIQPTNANPKGYILAVTTSTNSSEAINIKNQGVNAIFYALDGGSTIQNTAQVTALVAKSILIKNSASLTYDQGLASSQFSSGPGGSWQIKKGTYRFTSEP